MAIDFSKISAKKKESLPVDPVELFQKLKVSDPNINDLWLAQGDALREWHNNRIGSDVGIVLNTGAGKTLVGLLIAQSLVNETKGKILYACSSIQLVEQTADKGKGYGLNTTTYYKQRFNNDLFHQGKAPCITTYQALFNGRSIFFNEEIEAIIFDDAHAAEHLLRDHFSLQIEKKKLPSLYKSIVELFREYHQQIGRIGSYEELVDGTSSDLFLVPPFELQCQLHELIRLLSEEKLSDPKETTRFAWEYIKDKIDLCCVLLSSTTITITPPFIPIRCLPYFKSNVRKIYLSATLKASDAFTRTFGKVPDKIIAPSTTAGECERLILFPSRLNSMSEDLKIAKELLEDKKALILVPTYARAKKWVDFALSPDKTEVSEEVKRFKKVTTASKLLLTARYDGIDLPGDTCRIMVIDDIPMGVGPLERFLWDHLRLSNSLRTTISSRIVQSFGRISRGMSDHGVVLITGEELVKWLLTPRNAAVLPAFLQKQIKLGFEISEAAVEIDDFKTAITQCLNREEGWVTAYNDFMNEAEPENINEPIDHLNEIAQSEAKFSIYIWNRDYIQAAKAIEDTLETAFDLSESTGAWHSLWLGRAYELMGDNESAKEMYYRAHGAQRNIPPLPSHGDKEKQFDVPVQVIEVDRQMKSNPGGKFSLPKNIHPSMAHLDGSGTSGQTEECLRALGQYLGLSSTRPEKEHGTGPDVLWQSPGRPALCIEVKTDKKAGSNYQKKETGQLSDHVQWVKDNTDAKEIIPLFIGPVSPATETANPSEDFRVADLKQFQLLAERLTSALNDIAASALPITLRKTIYDSFKKRDLLWPECFESLESFILRDL